MPPRVIVTPIATSRKLQDLQQNQQPGEPETPSTPAESGAGYGPAGLYKQQSGNFSARGTGFAGGLRSARQNTANNNNTFGAPGNNFASGQFSARGNGPRNHPFGGGGGGMGLPPRTPMTSRSGTGGGGPTNNNNNNNNPSSGYATQSGSASPFAKATSISMPGAAPATPRGGGSSSQPQNNNNKPPGESGLQRVGSVALERTFSGAYGKQAVVDHHHHFGSGATPSARSESHLDMTLTQVLSGAMQPKLAVSASRADIVLSLQQRLRDSYVPLTQLESRGLFFPVRAGPGAAPMTTSRYTRRKALFNDPTERAFLSVYREDTASLGAASNMNGLSSQHHSGNAGQEGGVGGGRGGFTCVEDSLPARLAIFQPDHYNANSNGALAVLPDQHGSLVVITGYAGIGKSMIWKQLCAQQRVPGALVIHVPLIKLRSSKTNNNNNNEPKNQLETIGDVMRAIESPCTVADVNQIVRHRIPIVWCLDGFESERRYCQDFLNVMVTMKKSREAAGQSVDGSGTGFDLEAANALENSNGEVIPDMRDFNDLRERFFDTVILSSVDGSISVNPNSEKQDSLVALQKLTTTSLASIAATTQQRVSNIEKWTVQRWPMGTTKDFIKKYCTGKAKPHKIIKNNNNNQSGAASPVTPQTKRLANGTTINIIPSSGNKNNFNINNNNNIPETKVPAEDYLWNTILSLNQMGSLIGVPLFLQCVCDVFIGNEDLLESLRISGNPKVTLFDLCLKLQWSKHLPSVEALLTSSTLTSAEVIAATGSPLKLNKSSNNLERSTGNLNNTANNNNNPLHLSLEQAFDFMTDAAGSFCVDLIARGGMECDVVIDNKNKKQNNEPLWLQLLALIGVVRKIKMTSENNNSKNKNGNDDDEQQDQVMATARPGDSNEKMIVKFHNRLLVEYFAACHISKHPEKLSKIPLHTKNRFLWMALTFMSSENSRVLSQQGFFNRISAKYAEDHPLWLDRFVSHISEQFYERYMTLPVDLRHDRRKTIALAAYTHTPLLVEMSTVLGSDAATLMTSVKRRHGFFGKTFRMPSHVFWSFELCGDYGAASTLNWIIDNYNDQVTKNAALLSRTLARALQREQLGSITAKTTEAATTLTSSSSQSPTSSSPNSNAEKQVLQQQDERGVIHRLYELGATIELFTAVRLGSTTAVAECFETPEFTLDADTYRQCLMIAVENRDSDMTALLLSHARCAELLDAWVVAAVFILRPRVRFTNKSVQRKPEPKKSGASASPSPNRLGASTNTTNGVLRKTSSIYGSPERKKVYDEDGNLIEDSSFYVTQMTTLEFLEDWTKDCQGLHPDQLKEVDALMKMVLQRQLDYEKVHTQAAEMAAGRGSMIVHNFQAAMMALRARRQDQNSEASTQQINEQQKKLTPAAAAVAALAALHPANKDKPENNNNTNNSSSSNNNNNNSETFNLTNVPAAQSHTMLNFTGLNLAATTTNNSNNNINSTTNGESSLDNFLNQFGGVQYCIEVRIDALFWWMADSKTSHLAIAPENPEDVHFIAFDEFPNSFQLDTIVGTIGDCEVVRHVSLRLQECEQLADPTLISLVQSVGPKLVELGVTYAGDITDAAMLSLARYCPHLAALDVTRCYCLTNKSLEAFAQNLKNLRKLVMEFACLCDDEGLITAVEHAPNLDTLDVAYCKDITDMSLLVVASKCPKLEHLRLDGCELVTDAALVTIAVNCTKLKSLKCRDVVEISSEGIAAIAEHCPVLRCLDLSFCWRLDDQAIFGLASGCPKLEELWLTECTSVSEKALTQLFANCRELKSIDLSGVFKVGDLALTTLATRNKRSLENLAVSRCDKISDASIQKICLHCKKLRTLYVNFCDLLTDKTLVAVLSDAKRVIDFQCSPSVVQESKRVFSEYLMGAVAESLDKRRLYESEHGCLIPIEADDATEEKDASNNNNNGHKRTDSVTPVTTPLVSPRNKVPPKYAVAPTSKNPNDDAIMSAVMSDSHLHNNDNNNDDDDDDDPHRGAVDSIL